MSCFDEQSAKYGKNGEALFYFNLDDEDNDTQVVVRVSELVRCLKHFRESLEYAGGVGDYEHDMREIGGHLWAMEAKAVD